MGAGSHHFQRDAGIGWLCTYYSGGSMVDVKHAIVAYLPWLLSLITIWMTVLAGNKHRSAWSIGLVNQALWLLWIALSHNWGFLPMNLALWVVYCRNHLKWNYN